VELLELDAPKQVSGPRGALIRVEHSAVEHTTIAQKIREIDEQIRQLQKELAELNPKKAEINKENNEPGAGIGSLSGQRGQRMCKRSA
jgi:hypothetical protein